MKVASVKRMHSSHCLQRMLLFGHLFSAPLTLVAKTIMLGNGAITLLAVHATGLGTVTARVTEPSGDPVGPVH